ncbi:hypothetical protein [Azospirillum halopraeferens]|uniref:hypothetical protein n=1 Tax=Azospirillum halopraeferens TaxID=34010 RepID=UPI0004198C3D|nr:hypothetical protein [Azospirillum halopraeferens]
MAAYYNRAKAPVLNAIAATPGLEVDALEGTEQAIVIGPAGTLMTLIQNEPLLSRDDIDVLPNDPEYARPA